MSKLMIAFFGALVVVIIGVASCFTLTEGQQALITQFGQIQGQPITNAGLHFKLPFIQDVRFFDKRILSWDGDEEQIPTKDKKYIWVDTTARWRITDVRKFAETVQSEDGARNRLDGILDGVTRDTISNQNLVEAVRNSNAILERRSAKRDQKNERPKNSVPTPASNDPTDADDLPGSGTISAAAKQVTQQLIEEEITGEIEPIAKGREALSQLIADRARIELEPFGIDLIDVQLRRIAYEKSVEDKVYDRMISERNRIAEKIRSIGKGEEAKIRGKLNKDLKRIESQAYERSQGIKGRADAEATGIYASSLAANSEFYRFNRTLELYKKTIPARGQIMLSTDAAFFDLLSGGSESRVTAPSRNQPSAASR